MNNKLVQIYTNENIMLNCAILSMYGFKRILDYLAEF